ncbi:hypothetical protein FRC10_000511 [Ceratobasidium sp. 414]|nr:hypothetical protein FRC10_000511 [Ceratobasidium sp. 414]
MERLCHRKGIRGRSTVVLRVREVIPRRPLPDPEPEPTEDGLDAAEWNGIRTRGQKTQEQEETQGTEEAEILGSRDYILKLMWRESEKRSEGEIMEKLVGIYGLAQYLWHSDVFKSKCSCKKPKKQQCKQCPDVTPDRDGVLACKNLTDLDIEVPNEEDGREANYNHVRTDEYSMTYASCSKRVYCRLLMSTVGEPLWAAESPRRLLEAVLDAILGYWRLFNKGVLHRDISDGNVMTLQEGQRFDHREWKAERPTTDSTADPRTSSSEKLLQQYLEKLDRDPRGVLSDFDLSATRSEMEKTFFGNTLAERNTPTPPVTVEPRRSTRHKENSRPSSNPILYSDRVIGVKKIDFRTPYNHHFLDDLESFFWLILWSTAAHLDPHVSKGTYDALVVVNNLDHPSLTSIYTQKRTLLSDCDRFGGKVMKSQLASFGNNWAKDPMVVSVIVDLGSFFHGIDNTDLGNPNYEPDIVFPCVVDIIMNALGA